MSSIHDVFRIIVKENGHLYREIALYTPKHQVVDKDKKISSAEEDKQQMSDSDKITKK